MGDAIGMAIDASLKRLLTDQPTVRRVATQFLRADHILNRVAIVTKRDVKFALAM